MKHIFRLTLLLAAVLCLTACHKCPPEGDHTVVYCVDNGPEHRVILSNDAEWQSLLDRFCDYAESGSTVTFYNANRIAKGVATKEATTFSTTSREEMKRWMAQMEDDGKTVTVSYNPATGTYSGTAYATAPEFDNQWVDLGLPSGLLWATCNIGASTPEDYGDYFAWGETATKEVYTQGNYIHCNGSLYSLTKYCNNADWGDNGYTDTLSILEPSDDAATVILGGGARMPTRADWQELIDNTVGEWVDDDTIYFTGYWRFTAPNGNTLCLPAAGEKADNGVTHGDGYGGIYWSSELDTVNPYPWNFRFRYVESTSSYVGELNNNFSNSHRHMGHSVRAVRPRN